ncbi:Acyl-CoA thioesterase [Pseudomonas sp. NFACC32-1]|uniref:thioesterase family protein n=1 Tax=Pseudomonas TaxID=286 RepID=UPI00087641C5|nr:MULTISPECIES: thioesterase family protein [Pseudomonas]MDB6444455.1 thioesterase family protein [Pseudomonas sp. 21TX0197]MDT8904156.1 thioesterase family protein [Pseudomonas prosekii]ROO40343.1 acyl-CoA thioesterase [Pseudomonas sp. 7SR1]SCX67706.1 Acyl-CoA thioesterase [Pseudomonas sp. NFACC32-1]SFX82381.1 Acyl-CoA thioesterase [Pseudomonas sp. NFACC49-2]
MSSLAGVIQRFDPAAPFVAADNWRQGRTVFGGLSAALSLQTVLLETGADLPPFKSAQVSFIGPVTDAQTFNTSVLRRGRSMTSVAVDCMSGNDLALRTTLSFALPRTSRIVHEAWGRPAVAGPTRYPVLHLDRQIAPACAFNFEMRPAGGSLPMTGADHPELLMWVRHLDAQGVDPAVALIALADSLPPAAMTCFTEPAAISSASWMIDLPQPATAGRWFLINAFSRQALEGYSLQDMEIWDESGRRVLWARQTVAVFI